MRANCWKRLFEEKGWLQKGKIIVPDVKTKPLIYFRYKPTSFANSIKLDSIIKIDEDFIVSKNENNVIGNYLWEDIFMIYENPLI